MLRLFKKYYPIRNIFFVTGEFLFICLSVYAASLILLGTDTHLKDTRLWAKILIIAVFCQMCLYYNDMYDIRQNKNFLEIGIRLIQALGAAAIGLAVVYFIFPQAIIGNGVFVISIFLIIVFIMAWRFGYQAVLERGLFDQRVILLGSGTLAEDIAKEIRRKKDCGYRISARVLDPDTEAPPVENDRNRTILKKGYEGTCVMAEGMGVQKVVVAIKERRGALPIKELLKCRVSGVEVLEGNTFYEMLTGKLLVEHIHPGWLIFTDGFRKTAARRFFKRFIDLSAVAVLLIALAPVFLIIALLIKIDSKGPVIFSQDRVGKNHEPYRMHKFRSMIDEAEKTCGPVWAKNNDPRITRMGRYLRRWRLDELPQLWNVLKGEMSFVGPRPEREHFVRQLEEKIPYYRERFTVKPGITGWAQVSYRYGASVEDAVEKLNYDLFYIKNMSVWMDLLILFKTVKIVLFAKGSR